MCIINSFVHKRIISAVLFTVLDFIIILYSLQCIKEKQSVEGSVRLSVEDH